MGTAMEMSSGGAVNQKPIYNLSPSRPRFAVPAGACDTHFHVIGDDPRERRNPTAPSNAPCRTPWSALDAMHKALGIERGVLVQNTVMCRDYDVLIDSLIARPRLRGVALIDDSTKDNELVRLDQSGVRGARFHFARYMKHHQSSWDVFQRTISRIAQLGWHVVVHIDPESVIEHGSIFRDVPVPVVIDNLANVDFQKGIRQPEFLALLDLQKAENIWIKICNIDRLSKAGPPSYSDGHSHVSALVANNAERLMWGSDWPHALYMTKQDIQPKSPADDGQLFNVLYDVVPNEETLRRILVDNPKRLYGFLD